MTNRTVARIIHWPADVISYVIHWLSHLTGLSVAIFAAAFGAVAGITGIIALVIAILSYRKSTTANQIAASAQDLAEEANARAEGQEARETERHDVHWETRWDWSHPGRYLLIKRGNDEAHEVGAKMTYTSKSNTEEQTANASLMVTDGETLAVDFSTAVLDLRDQRAALAEIAKDPGLAGINQARASTNTQWLRTVAVRVDWQTPLRTPKSFQRTYPALFNGYFRRRR